MSESEFKIDLTPPDIEQFQKVASKMSESEFKIDLTPPDIEQFQKVASKMSESEFEIDLTPTNICEKAAIANESALPEKSKNKYIAVYEQFVDWKTEQKAKSFSENVVLAYFLELSNKYQPSTLWSKYSMLKTMIKIKNDIDIKSYNKLSAFLKRQSTGYQSKKSKVLTAENVEKFINDAPDHLYLATKVALIFGVCGACRREELANITLKDVETQGNILIIQIPNTKNKIPRSFTVDGPFAEIVKKYQRQRSSKGKSDRFFQNYQKGKCTAQVIGLNKFGHMPKEIANFLNLPDADQYTGHTFRRTSATLLADAGGDITTLKRHGGWRSNNVAEGYIENSVQNKLKIGQKIASSMNIKPDPAELPTKQVSTFQPDNPEREPSSEPDVHFDFQVDPCELNSNFEPQPGTFNHSKPYVNFEPQLSPSNTDSCANRTGPSAFKSGKQHLTQLNKDHKDPPVIQTSQTHEINNSLNQTLNLPAETFNITLNNCTNCAINYYK